MPSRKANLRFFLVAMLSSLPLALLIATNDRSPSFFATVLLFLAPAFVGLIAIAWLTLAVRLLPKLWSFSPPAVGAAVGALSFLTYAVLLAIGAELTTRANWREILLAVGGVGMMLFGWIPLVCGGFAGWVAAKTDVAAKQK